MSSGEFCGLGAEVYRTWRTPAVWSPRIAFWCCCRRRPGRSSASVLTSNARSIPAKAGANVSGSSKSSTRVTTPLAPQPISLEGLRLAPTIRSVGTD